SQIGRLIREPFCGLSHSLGAALSVAGLVVLLVLAHGRPWQAISFTIYGCCLILLYTSSALYHSLRVGERYANWLLCLDHSAIYLLIAGSYAPICLVTLRGVWGWSLLGVECGLAAIGIATTFLRKGAGKRVRIFLCLAMGWLIIGAISPLCRLLPPAALAWMLSAGLVYGIGTVIYATDWPHLWPGRFSAHDLWHVFVLAGSTCYFVLILVFVVPMV
ncbi:MAG TPA: hemolysin III family protein, partial [Capsulimonadaceae bacterium]|nr:hemolysin III family protein [Capsulimonadaceae bacterium]